MKKNIGDLFTMLSPFGYVFTGTVTGIIHESNTGGSSIYQAEFDGPGREQLEGELIPLDQNSYWPKFDKEKSDIEFVGVIENITKFN